MRLCPAPAALAPLLLAAGPAAALDFDKLDRRIVKEPAYRSKPLYGLALLGPDATTRVWLALDGERLYVDKNCNGDLTDDGPPAELKTKDSDPASYESIDVSQDGGRTVYKFDVTLWGRPSFVQGATDREPFNQSVHVTLDAIRLSRVRASSASVDSSPKYASTSRPTWSGSKSASAAMSPSSNVGSLLPDSW